MPPMTPRPSDFVDPERLMARLDALAQIGATAAGGVNRPALSAEDARAQRLMAAWGEKLGLHATRDAAGNFFLRWPGAEPALAPLLSGSHLDSQPTGGRYDGAYGVVAALEAVQALQEAGVRPQRGIDVVAWMNEEGSRFAPGMMGSAVFAGQRTLEAALAVRDAAGVSVREALDAQAALLDAIPLRCLGGPVHAYVEAHIEQGPVLEREGIPIGVVTGIQGKHTFRVCVQGEAAHAGTSARAERKDALLAATAMVQALASALHDARDMVKFTVGRFDVTPSAPSVVASKVVFSVDLRHPDTAELRRLSAMVEITCKAHAGPCDVQVERLSEADSLTFPEDMRRRVRRAADTLSLPHRDLISAAGHDARYLHTVCPSAMIFVPCRGGVTHNEEEYAQPGDLHAGTRVLAEVLAGLATGAAP
ncbi:Zn-dependent hydrolase [Bordetella genomosp. 9]|uniref:Zn-dependent hydrolase n=2 Tax=Bordetella genomosp. 9 TaxID=1416803 RepID=A0A1W6YYF5_9BORD|nr:Zn-dependent hydrolase [Bordetella genomosp. 9]